MKLRCAVCGHEQDAEHLAVACGGCGARGAMKFAPVADGLKPGEPIVGPSRAPITGGSRAAMRGPHEEPLEVTRERGHVYNVSIGGGMTRENARAYALRKVPVQCGLCGGSGDAGCVVCGGRATAPVLR